MAKIIDFEKARQEREKKPESEKKKLDSGIPAESIMQLFLELLKNPERSGDMIKEVTDKMIRIKHSTGAVNHETLRKNREIVRSYSPTELINWIRKSNENDWLRKPAFYQAVADELRDRLGTLLKKE